MINKYRREQNMKTKVKLLLAIALIASACTTGLKVTSGGYSDDLYFTPGDARPVAPKPAKEAKKPVAQKKSMVAMQVEEGEQGKIVNSYIVPKSSRKDNNAYYFDDQPAYADTVMEYKNNKEEITINNYFEGEEMDYSSRIRSFYNPYSYNPFWDPFWDPYYGSNYGFGFGRWGMGFGGYSPYMGFGGFYDPWYMGYGWGGFGWGGYSPYMGWGGYYSGFGWGGGYGYADFGGGGMFNNKNHFYGKKNYDGKNGGSNAVRYGMNTFKNGNLTGGGLSGQSGFRNLSGSTRTPAGGSVNTTISGTRAGVVGSGAASTRLSGTRDNTGATVLPQNQVNNTQGLRAGRGETVTNLRRSNNNPVQGSGAAVQGATYSRPAVGASGYTPTYNRPRMNTQSSYSSGSTRQYSSPQNAGTSSQTSRYSRPESTGSSTTRTQSSGSYQRGSVTSTPNVTSGNSNNSGRSYAPTRSNESSGSSSRSFSPSYTPSSSGSSVGGSSGTRSSGSSSGTSSGGGSGRQR